MLNNAFNETFAKLRHINHNRSLHYKHESALLWQKEASDIPSKSELLMFSYVT